MSNVSRPTVSSAVPSHPYASRFLNSVGPQLVADWYRNATIMDDSQNASEVSYVEACDVVCTVTSTLGCEALALGKPVVTLGATAFGKYTITIQCHKDVHKLSALSKFDQKRPRIRAFLYNLFRSSYGAISLPEVVNTQAKYVYL